MAPASSVHAQKKFAPVRPLLKEPLLNIENLPSRIQKGECTVLPPKFYPPIMSNCPPTACQPCSPCLPPPCTAYCIPPPLCVPSCYFPCTPTPPPMCCPPPCPPVMVCPPPCSPCSPCPPPCCPPCPPPCCPPAPCLPPPCQPCVPKTGCCGGMSVSCCGPKQIVCIPRRAQVMMGGCGNSTSQARKGGAAKKHHESGVKPGINDQPASYNNCNFYLTDIPNALRNKFGLQKGLSGDDECTEEGETEECTDETDYTSTKGEDDECEENINVAAGDDQIMHPPVGYPGSQRTSWGAGYPGLTNCFPCPPGMYGGGGQGMYGGGGQEMYGGGGQGMYGCGPGMYGGGGHGMHRGGGPRMHRGGGPGMHRGGGPGMHRGGGPGMHRGGGPGMHRGGGGAGMNRRDGPGMRGKGMNGSRGGSFGPVRSRGTSGYPVSREPTNVRNIGLDVNSLGGGDPYGRNNGRFDTADDHDDDHGHHDTATDWDDTHHPAHNSHAKDEHCGPNHSSAQGKGRLKQGGDYRPYFYSHEELTKKSEAYLPEKYDVPTPHELDRRVHPSRAPITPYATHNPPEDFGSRGKNGFGYMTPHTRTQSTMKPSRTTMRSTQHAHTSTDRDRRCKETGVSSSHFNMSGRGFKGSAMQTSNTNIGSEVNSRNAATRTRSEPNFGRSPKHDDKNVVPIYRTSTQTRLQIIDRPNEPSEIRVVQRPVQEVAGYQNKPPNNTTNNLHAEEHSRINLDVVTDDQCIDDKKPVDPCHMPKSCIKYHTRRLHRLCSFSNRRKKRLSQLHKPMFHYKAPPCPIRETVASILRKHPPARCKWHEQDAPPFHEYCMADHCPDTNKYPLLTRDYSPHRHAHEREECLEEQAGRGIQRRGAKRKQHHR